MMTLIVSLLSVSTAFAGMEAGHEAPYAGAMLFFGGFWAFIGYLSKEEEPGRLGIWGGLAGSTLWLGGYPGWGALAAIVGISMWLFLRWLDHDDGRLAHEPY